MYTLFYLLAYLAIIGFVCLAVLKIADFLKASPLHVRWELYPVPHEGPVRGEYGGSFMEETDWWTKQRHVDHWMDIKAMLLEIFFLHSTYENKPKLWLRSYPFHMGLYMLMGGCFLLLFAVILQFCGAKPHNGFIVFIGNIINAISLFGSVLIAGGSISLIIRRTADKGLHKYTTREMYFNLGAFALYAMLTLLAWTFNPSYFELARKFLFNLFTCNFRPLGSTWFVLNMLAGFALLVWIPLTNMRHILIKYFLYHDIRWGDTPTVWSEKNKEKINEMLKFKTDWSASHITGGNQDETWVDVATTNPASPEK